MSFFFVKTVPFLLLKAYCSRFITPYTCSWAVMATNKAMHFYVRHKRHTNLHPGFYFAHSAIYGATEQTITASQEMATAFHCSCLPVASGSLRKSTAAIQDRLTPAGIFRLFFLPGDNWSNLFSSPPESGAARMQSASGLFCGLCWQESFPRAIFPRACP
ncbi:hypothetical protein SAMN05660330_03672 [Desulforhopalus singaporensis]|uniref:Uncharacterized protein n=1 Tax=Desulforhopalus singaporensis TaxID=91360 RepID=A0A1H0UQF8_9BACT|nr:hypothetical protein SAMN05660330_03672 [Desulforhopalus singaporensis]